jgi:hypothetical protein
VNRIARFRLTDIISSLYKYQCGLL